TVFLQYLMKIESTRRNNQYIRIELSYLAQVYFTRPLANLADTINSSSISNHLGNPVSTNVEWIKPFKTNYLWSITLVSSRDLFDFFRQRNFNLRTICLLPNSFSNIQNILHYIIHSMRIQNKTMRFIVQELNRIVRLFFMR